ncbi:MAG: hypothetical protein GY777_19395 [Candidatus Brocadiaceae bacterium]|nr:hypothetical protein [Candidatus Brocadiaceae bacterium]
MEEGFITQLKEDIKGEDFGSKQDDLNLWYNEEGDCIQFKTMHVATVGKRIDDFLTLYLSIEDNKPIGFQLKDIHALISKYDIDLITIQAGYESSDKRLVSISALLFKAFAEMNTSINRVAGYSEAFRTIARDVDSVEIPVLQ